MLTYKTDQPIHLLQFEDNTGTNINEAQKPVINR